MTSSFGTRGASLPRDPLRGSFLRAASAVLAAVSCAVLLAPVASAGWRPGFKPGGEHTCLHLYNGTSRCFGFGFFGPLGNEGRDSLRARDMASDIVWPNYGAIPMRDFEAGLSSTCATTYDGRLYCIGITPYGSRDPGTAEESLYIGTQPGDMQLVEAAKFNVSDYHVSSVSARTADTILCTLGAAPHYYPVCHGNGKSGATLMDEPTPYVEFPADGVKSPEEVAARPLSDPPLEVYELYASDVYNCAVLSNFRAKCWGVSFTEDLGAPVIGDSAGDYEIFKTDVFYFDHNPLINGKWLEIDMGRTHLLFLNEDGGIVALGYPEFGQLGNCDSGESFGLAGGVNSAAAAPEIVFSDTVPAVSICAGYRHSCAVFENKKVRCWGSNSDGQLGMPSVANWTGLPSQMLAHDYVDLPGEALEIACGLFHSCAQVNNTGVAANDGWICWGNGANYRAGTDDTISVWDPSSGLEPIPFTNVPGMLKLYDTFPLLLHPDNANGTHIDIRGPVMVIRKAVKLRLTDTVNPAQTVTVALQRFSTHHVRSAAIPSWSAYMATPSRTQTTVTLELLDASDAVLASHDADGVGEVVFAPIPGTPSLVSPTGLVAGERFIVKVAVPGIAAAGLTSRSHGMCIIGDQRTLLAYDGDGDNLICSGFLSESTELGEYPVRIILGNGFPDTPTAEKMTVYQTSLVEADPPVGYFDASVNVTLTGTGIVDLPEGALCRFSDPATEGQLITTPITVPAVVVDNTTVICTRPALPDLSEAVTNPYDLLVDLSCNGGIHWTEPLAITAHAEIKLTLALPAALPAGGGVTLTVYGSGFVQSPSAVLKFVLPGYDPILMAAQFSTSTQLFEAATSAFPEGSTDVQVTLAIDGQSFTVDPVPTTVFELISHVPVSGPRTGGTSVTVTGRGFTPVSGSLFCGFSIGVAAAPGAFGSSTRVVCISPASPSASAAVFDFGITFNGNDYSTTPTSTFRYYDASFDAVVPDFLPSNRPRSLSGVTETFMVTGSGIFGDIPRCRVAGQILPATLAPDGSHVNCTVWPGLVQESIEVLLNGADAQSTGLAMSYYDVYQTIPALAPRTGTTTATILGARFPLGQVPTCRFGAIEVTGTLESASRLTCAVPDSAVVATVPLEVSFDGGEIFTDGALQFEYIATPAVTAVHPASGQEGTLVTVYGTDFTDSVATSLPMRCKFGSAPVLATNLVLTPGPPPHFMCPAPALAGTTALEVSFNDGATYTTDALQFLFISVLSLNPTLGPVSGGSSVLVSGTGFEASGTPVCRFTTSGGVHFTSASVLSNGQLRCQTPAIAAVDPAVAVEVSNDNSSFTDDGRTFAFFAEPQISACAPTHLPDHGVGLVFTLHGSFPTSIASEAALQLGPISTPCHYLSGSELRCSSGRNAGVQPIQVSMNGGFDFKSADPGVEITYVSLTGTEPGLGPASGGVTVTLAGSGFVPTNMRCRFWLTSGPQANVHVEVDAAYDSPAKGRCTLAPTPGLESGPGKIALSVDGGMNFTEPVDYLTYPDPRVTAVAPAFAPDSGGIAVTVYGDNLDRANTAGSPAWVRFGKSPSPVTEQVTLPGPVGESFVCDLPPGAGTQEITVSLNNGYFYSNASSAGGGPVVVEYYSVFLTDPSAGPMSGATDVLIFGSNFHPQPGARCRFGATAVPATFISSGQVRCSSPPLPAGVVNVGYAFDGSLFTESSLPFSYFTGPVIDSIVPSHAPLGSGAVISVLGSGFFDTPAFICRFGDTVSANASYVAPTLVTCPMPIGDGVVEITLSFNGGAQFSSFGVMFSYITLNSIFPSLGPAGGGTKVILIGSGFENTEGAKCIFGGVQVPARVASSSSLECDTPPSAVGPVAVTYTGDFGNLVTTSPHVFEYYATPSVTALEPTEGPSSGGYRVTVHGVNFNNTVAASYCRVGLANIVPSPPTVVGLPTGQAYFCDVPRGSGIEFIEISLNDGVTFSDDQVAFTYYSVFAMVPTLGPSTGDTPIVVSGTGFKDVPGAVCRFGLIDVPATFVSEAEVQCRSPAQGASILAVEYSADTVRYTGDAKLFHYFLDPVATAIVPSGGPSFGANLVTIFGQNFQDVGVAIKCRFGVLTSNAVIGTVPGSIVCAAPPGSSEVPIAVSLNNGFQFAESPLTYSYVSLARVEPDHGLLLGNTTLTLSGTGFLASAFAGAAQDPYYCDFGAAGKTRATVFDASRINCDSPGVDEPSITSLTLTGPNEFDAGDFGIQYTFDAVPVSQPPDPPVGPTAGGTRVIIVGENFVVSDTQQCMFGETRVTGSISFSASGAKIVCVTPALSGDVPLSISFNERDFSLVGTFHFYFVAAATPIAGPTTGGTVISIFGDGFLGDGSVEVGVTTGATANVGCFVEGYEGVARVVSATMIHCFTPRVSVGTSESSGTRRARRRSEIKMPWILGPDAAARLALPGGDGDDGDGDNGGDGDDGDGDDGDGDDGESSRRVSRGWTPRRDRGFSALQATNVPLRVMVSLLGSGLSGNDKVTFIYYDPFTIESVTPSVGRTAGGLEVTIRGKGFTSSTGILNIRFGPLDGIGSVCTFISSSEIRCTTPPHVAETIPVQMTQNNNEWISGPDFTFEECLPGTFARVFSDPCTPCPTSFAAASPGSRQCTRCPIQRFADKEGMAECTLCPENSLIAEETRDSIDRCLCERNFYTVTGLPGSPCLPCPEGGVCPGELTAPLPLPGYWTDRSPDASLNPSEGFVFFRCDFPEACVGNGIESCRVGYTGRLCSECDVGFFKRGPRCRECPDSSYFSIVAFFVFIVIACVGLYKMVGTDVSAYGGTLNIIAYFFQVVGILAKLDLSWPVEVESTMAFISSPFSLDVDVLASECSIPEIGFQVKWLSMMMLPIIFFGVFSVIYVLAKIASFCTKTKRGPTQASIGDGLVNAYLLFLALAYLMLVSTSFKIFDCTDRGQGEFTLDAQPSLLCYEEWWWQLAPLALAGIFGYGFVVPSACALLIQRNRNALTTPRVVGRYGSIFIDYTPEKPYWESVVMIEKFSFALTMTFFTSFVDVQIIAFLLVTVMGLALQIVANPFFVQRYNKLQAILRWCSCIMIVAGMIFRTGNFPVEILRLLVIGCVFGIIGGACIGVAGIVIYDVIMIRRSLSGSLFPAETTKYINLITHPQGRTTIMEWLGNHSDPVMQERVANVVNSIGAYYEENFDSTPERTTPRRTTQRVINFFASDIFLDTPLPAIQMWFTENTSHARMRRDPESIAVLRDFLIVFTELSRFRLYESVGIKRSRISNMPSIAIPWLDEIEAGKAVLGSEDDFGDANGLLGMSGVPGGTTTDFCEEEVDGSAVEEIGEEGDGEAKKAESSSSSDFSESEETDSD